MSKQNLYLYETEFAELELFEWIEQLEMEMLTTKLGTHAKLICLK